MLASSFSRQSRPRSAQVKSASGGLRRYTGSKLFEKPYGTKDFTLFERKPRQGAELAQTNGADASTAKNALVVTDEGSKANLERRQKIAEVAVSYNGVTDLAYKPSDPGTCNVFVAGVIEESGAPKPLVTKADGRPGIPGASEWATSPIPNWRILKKSESPAPGDVGAVPDRGRPGFSAHTMIVYNTENGKIRVMEAGRNSIHPRDVTAYKDIIYRRYTGE